MRVELARDISGNVVGLLWREIARLFCGISRKAKAAIRIERLSVSRRGARMAKAEPALSIIYANARPWFKIVPLVDGKVAKELKTLKMPSDQRVPKSEHDVGKLS